MMKPKVLMDIPQHQLKIQAVKSQRPGRKAHHSGWSGIALTPRWMNLKETSCSRGSAVSPLPPGPVQNTCRVMDE